MKCKHIESIELLQDRTGWVVGSYCERCKRFWARDEIPNFKTRMKDKIMYGRKR